MLCNAGYPFSGDGELHFVEQNEKTSEYKACAGRKNALKIKPNFQCNFEIAQRKAKNNFELKILLKFCILGGAKLGNIHLILVEVINDIL